MKREAIMFVHDIQDLLHEMIPQSSRAVAALEEIQQFEHYFLDPAGNPRLILEHVAVTI